MRLSMLLSLAALSISPLTLAVAGADCSCSDQCMSDCQKGVGKDCECKDCDCKKTGKCSHGKCDKDHKGHKDSLVPAK